jgi:hypothetical protein
MAVQTIFFNRDNNVTSLLFGRPFNIPSLTHISSSLLDRLNCTVPHVLVIEDKNLLRRGRMLEKLPMSESRNS